MTIWMRIALVLGSVAIAQAADAAEIKMMAANAVRESLQPLATAFTARGQHRVSIAWGGTDGVAKRIADGEVVDLVLVGGAGIDRLVVSGKLVPASRVDYARSGVGVAVRLGMPVPDIATAEAVRATVLAARTIGYSSGPSGAAVAELFRRLGIADAVADRVRQPPSGAQMSDLLARGEIDLGFQQVSELIHAPGIRYVGPLPPEIQSITVYAAGVHAAAPEAAAAREFLAWLASPEADATVRASGMERD
ncbi:MAG: substrate-binding domain-containing protein [Alphaproteobacteria bacterium]